jgi:protein-S-isoprenylcysteine O-methyltransferase Ste14
MVWDGDGVRYVGLLLFIVGATVRGVAVFTLGYRFSGLVAIQEGHTLVTHGIFRRLRHPSYLGGMMAMMGWMLVFRSLIVLLFIPSMLALLIWRMNAEERLLTSEFGEEYEVYKRRTWRLVPYVY